MSHGAACEVAIVGAGPYGLSAAAHLRAAGVETRIFGEAMQFWESRMPKGMCLRSSWEASHVAHPDRALTLDHYEEAHKSRLSKPIPLDDFIRYGRWYQGRAVPDLDRRRIRRIESRPDGFRLELEDGESLRSRHVVVAAGIASFVHRPPIFDGLPLELVSHSSDHRDFGPFRGQQVVIVGAGQSALESAALLREAGADVEVLVRGPRVLWLDQRAGWLKSEYNPLRPLLYPPTDVGPPVLNLIVATPGLFRRLPAAWQKWIAYRSIRPAGAGWLLPRMNDVRITVGRNVTRATIEDGRIGLQLDDTTVRRPDHVLLATGYRVDVSRYRFLAPEILAQVRRVDGYPLLGAGFESTLPGLHFLGAPAAHSFGPVCRFVSGTTYMGRKLTKAILGGWRRNRAALGSDSPGLSVAERPVVFNAPGPGRPRPPGSS
jgi:cation diffusion facilitator CzcD-associated flavoprotein CzcO